MSSVGELAMPPRPTGRTQALSLLFRARQNWISSFGDDAFEE